MEFIKNSAAVKLIHATEEISLLKFAEKQSSYYFFFNSSKANPFRSGSSSNNNNKKVVEKTDNLLYKIYSSFSASHKQQHLQGTAFLHDMFLYSAFIAKGIKKEIEF